MKKFLKVHQDQVLIFLAILMLGIIVGYYAWGITTLASIFRGALTPPDSSNQFIQFDIEAAKALGVVYQPTERAPAERNATTSQATSSSPAGISTSTATSSR